MTNDLHIAPDEKIVLKLRKHWLLLVRDTIGTLILAFLPFIFFTVISLILSLPNLGQYLSLIAFLTALWFLLIWLALAVLWTDYYLDLWIVTDRRIISIDQISLFNRKVTTLGHDRIQEIIVKEENFMQAFFGYGKLDIETASPTDGDATMEGIPHPENVRRVILDQMLKKTTLSV